MVEGSCAGVRMTIGEMDPERCWSMLLVEAWPPYWVLSHCSMVPVATLSSPGPGPCPQHDMDTDRVSQTVTGWCDTLLTLCHYYNFMSLNTCYTWQTCLSSSCKLRKWSYQWGCLINNQKSNWCHLWWNCHLSCFKNHITHVGLVFSPSVFSPCIPRS